MKGIYQIFFVERIKFHIVKYIKIGWMNWNNLELERPNYFFFFIFHNLYRTDVSMHIFSIIFFYNVKNSRSKWVCCIMGNEIIDIYVLSFVLGDIPFRPCYKNELYITLHRRLHLIQQKWVLTYMWNKGSMSFFHNRQRYTKRTVLRIY